MVSPISRNDHVSSDSISNDVPPNKDSDSNVDSTLFSINDLVLQLGDMNIKIRDMEREFFSSQQRVVHDRMVGAMETKREAIELNYNAAMTKGITQLISGVVSFGGAISGSQIASAATGSFGKTAEAGGAISAAADTREAGRIQILGDFQSSDAENVRKNTDKAADRAGEASRRLLDMTRELTELHGRMLAAVHF